ncbi:microtubule-associated protein futsch-like [Episyrphus balteatus]|uniref:microtubule-associated protein futsch-like n=1 Tax=Episyrphus balteatus TaxID=286459 RepID=UPI0024857877|nr:microtubule-associated protein futsch-like [Episyrphus balteatus]
MNKTDRYNTPGGNSDSLENPPSSEVGSKDSGESQLFLFEHLINPFSRKPMITRSPPPTSSATGQKSLPKLQERAKEDSEKKDSLEKDNNDLRQRLDETLKLYQELKEEVNFLRIENEALKKAHQEIDLLQIKTTPQQVVIHEYKTDEEELERETERSSKNPKRRTKKRKVFSSPEGASSSETEVVKTPKDTSNKEKPAKIRPPPAINVVGVAEFNNHFKGVTANEFQKKNYKILDAENIIKKERQQKDKETVVVHRGLPLFILTFDKTEKLEEIYKIKRILSLVVKIEPLKKHTKQVPQCRRCQGFNHTQTYCKKEPRRVKCAGKYLTTDCTGNSKSPAKCINCNGSHPASYRGCEVAKELQKRREKIHAQRKLTKNQTSKTPKRVNTTKPATGKENQTPTTSNTSPKKRNGNSYAEMAASPHSLESKLMQSDDIAGTSKGAPATKKNPTAIKPTASEPTATTADMGKRRRQPLKPQQNLVKRRSTNEAAAKLHQKPEHDDVNYMSDGGEGYFVSGDSNKFAGLSSPEPSSDEEEEEEQTFQTKINEFERKMDALRQEVAPLIQLMKAKQEAHRAKEKQELADKADKEAAKAVKAAEKQQQEQLRLQQQQQQRQQQQQLPAQVAQQQLQQPVQVLEQQQQQQPKQQNKQQQQQTAEADKPSGSQQQVRTQQQQTKEQQRGKGHQQQLQIEKTKKENVPPINVFRMELEDTIKLLEEHKKIRFLLKEATTEYFSFTPKLDKIQTVLLKGIDSCTEPPALYHELRRKASDDLEIISVKPFQTALSRREKRKLPIFLVQLSPNSKLDSLRSITVLNYQVVTWDK